MARAALVLFTVVLIGEFALRAATWWAWSASLDRHPEIARRVAFASEAQGHMRAEHFFMGPEEFPVPVTSSGEEVPRWTTYGELPPSAFRGPPSTDAPREGVVRIAIAGDSVVFDGMPEELERLLSSRFGRGRVEVLNLGVPSATAETTLFLMRRFLPRWRPHIVVLYTGRNDMLLGRAFARATVAAGLGLAEEEPLVFAQPPQSFGIFGWLSAHLRTDPFAEPIAAAWIERIVVDKPMTDYWALSRLGWELGFDLYPSTYAAPSGDLDEASRDFFETEIRVIWPLLGSFDEYSATLGAHNDRIREFGAQTGHLIDVAAAVQGGQEVFRDVCHHTDDGRELHTRAVADALAEQIEEILEAGAPPPQSRALASEYVPQPVPEGGLPEEHPRDGSCVRGPCPAGTCFVPAGPSRFGLADEDLDGIFERALVAFPFAERFTWYGDEGPENGVVVSAFCVDRIEATRADHQDCVHANACPAFHYPDGEPTLPAIIPTYLDASLYCHHRGGRLPTDAEWDAAARGPEGRILPWGADWTGAEANFCGPDCRWSLPGEPDDGHEAPAPAGTFTGPSVYGAEDMAGNMWEWVADCFHNNIHRMLDDGARDPIAPPSEGCRRSLRGGSYASLGGFLERRTAMGLPDTDVPGRGVRCVYDFGTQHISPSAIDRSLRPE